VSGNVRPRATFWNWAALGVLIIHAASTVLFYAAMNDIRSQDRELAGFLKRVAESVCRPTL
jgi:hypothetical protein